MLRWKNNKIVFGENPFENAVMVDTVSVSYTLKSDDITKQERAVCTPYVSRKEKFDENGYAKITDTTLSVTQKDDGLEFLLESKSKELSEFGIYLPFNFMSKKNGGDWKEQFLFNSPYKSKNNEYIYCYFSNPSGRNIVVILQSSADGWKMDYSPYVCGHFFDNFKILANFDKAYKTGSERTQLKFSVFEVKDFRTALEKVSQLLDRPVVYYQKNAGAIGEEIHLEIFGNCDAIEVNGEKRLIKNKNFSYVLEREGDTHIIPLYNGNIGLDCTVYAFVSLQELYKRSMDSVSESDLRQTDGNLCEHQCWVAAMLRYMLKYGPNQEYEKKVKRLLDIITETDEEKAKYFHDITIFNKQQENGLPAWHIYGSQRIQEQFFGITILLDAYKYFGDEIYLSYAVNALNSLIEYYQSEEGGFITSHGGNKNDYSTVCCPMIPIVDMANYFKDKDIVLYDKYRDSAQKLASYLNVRGYSFPTETQYTDQAEEEHEDGSISCTALSLLYYSANIEQNQIYINKALEILHLHENWVVKTPIAQMFRSTLRWWETIWEGDKDGPALCMGHAWSIWRAEADYWAYVVTGDRHYLQNALGGFYGNFAKINEFGQSYAIYQADYITGGGLYFPNRVWRYDLANKYPKQTDSGLSRYVWIRAAETILK